MALLGYDVLEIEVQTGPKVVGPRQFGLQLPLESNEVREDQTSGARAEGSKE